MFEKNYCKPFSFMKKKKRQTKIWVILETQLDHVVLVKTVIKNLWPYKEQCHNVSLYKWPIWAKSTGFSCSLNPSKIGIGRLLLTEYTNHTKVHPIALVAQTGSLIPYHFMKSNRSKCIWWWLWGPDSLGWKHLCVWEGISVQLLFWGKILGANWNRKCFLIMHGH